MKLKATLLRVFSLAISITAMGCAVNPVTGERELSLVSTEQEIAIGEQQYAPSQQSQGGQYYIDPTLQSYVASALAALKEEDATAALGYLDQAIKVQPAEAQFWEMRGHAWSMIENHNNAEKAYGTAIRKNPELFSPLLYRGITRYRLDKLQAARGDLEASNALLPTAVSAYYLGDIHFQQGDETQATQYFQQAVSSSNKEVAARAYSKLAWIELEQRPDKYIASQPLIGQDRKMRIALLNRTEHHVAGVQVQLLEWVDPQTVRDIPLKRKRYKL